MKKQVAIIGLGRFGMSLARSLTGIGYEVLAIDMNDARIQGVATQITHAVHADSTDPAVLKELGVKNFDIVVVAIGSDIQSSVLIAVTLKEMGIPYLIAKANSKAHGEILRKIGVDKVVFPEEDAGIRLAHEIRMREISDYMPVTDNYGIAKVEVKDVLAGQSLVELGVGPKGKEGIALLFIQRGNEVIISPALTEVAQIGDILVISGSDDHLEAFLSRIVNGRRKNGK